MRIRFYFVRHAESKSNVDPYFDIGIGGENDVLTEKGEAQAFAVARRFGNVKVDALFSSKIPRAKLTAAEIEKVVGVKPVIVESIKERKGSFSSEVYEPTESFPHLKLRLSEAKNFFEQIQNSGHKHVVVVSHAEFTKSFLAYVMFGEALTEDSLLKVVRSLRFDNVAISKFVFNTEKLKWLLETWNDMVLE